MRAIVIPVEGDPRDVEQNGLSDLQDLVGGDIESIAPPEWMGEHVAVYCNEEGKVHGLPPNPKATEMLREVLRPDDFIVGPLVLTGFDPETGDSAPLPDDIKVNL